MSVAICWPCSQAGRIRLVDWWDIEGTPLCSECARLLWPDNFAEDVAVSKAYL